MTVVLHPGCQGGGGGLLFPALLAHAVACRLALGSCRAPLTVLADGSILDALNAVEICLERGGCQVVPGLPLEQWLWTLTTSILGGLIAGFAAYPRKEGETVAWAWLLLLSPLWIMLFGVFGIAPVITRTSDVLPLLRNSMGFLGGAVAAYLIAQATVGRQLNKETDQS